MVVIGENVWRNRFAGDPAILGRTIQLGATPHSIVGVMPKGFAFPVNHHFWVPLRAGFAPPEPLTGPDLMVFGRLAPGATLASAQAELAAIGQRTALAFPKIYAQLRPQVMPYPHPFVGMHGTKDVTGLLAMQGIVRCSARACLSERRDSRVYAHGDAPSGDRPAHRAGREPRPHCCPTLHRGVGSVRCGGSGGSRDRRARSPLDSHRHAAHRLRAALLGVVPALAGSSFVRRGAQCVRGGDRGHRACAPGNQTRVTDRPQNYRGGWHAARKDLDNPDRRAGQFRRGALAPSGLQRLGRPRGTGLPVSDSRQKSFSPRSWGWTPCRERAQRRPPARASSPAALQAGRPS